MRFAHDIIKRPLVTEKTTHMLQDEGKYTFEVDIRASKTQIKQALEAIFDVTVAEVRTMRIEGKLKRMGRFEGRRPNWKKAIVTLKEGDRIELFEGM